MKKSNFWSTQPLNSLKTSPRGDVDDKNNLEFTTEYYKPSDREELYKFICNNYVQDKDSNYTLIYEQNFFDYILRLSDFETFRILLKHNNKIIGFIMAYSTSLSQKKINKTSKTAIINFLCVEKGYRNKNLAPLLIKKITKECNEKNIFSAVFTSGTSLPNIYKRTKYHCLIYFEDYLKRKQKKETVRIAQNKDLNQVFSLYNKMCEGLELFESFTVEEFEKRFFSENSPIKVFVNEKDGQITEFCSFFTIRDLDLKTEATENNVYLYYYYSENMEMFKEWGYFCRTLKSSRVLCLDILNNKKLIEEYSFLECDTYLKYYLFNLEPVEVENAKIGLVFF